MECFCQYNVDKIRFEVFSNTGTGWVRWTANRVRVETEMMPSGVKVSCKVYEEQYAEDGKMRRTNV